MLGRSCALIISLAYCLFVSRLVVHPSALATVMVQGDHSRACATTFITSLTHPKPISHRYSF
jgi:hypothetical protein